MARWASGHLQEGGVSGSVGAQFMMMLLATCLCGLASSAPPSDFTPVSPDTRAPQTSNTHTLSLSLLAGCSLTRACASAANLNGEYLTSATPNGKSGQDWAKSFAKYPRGVQFFDAYSPPFQTLYSQVWWAGLKPLPLPEKIVKQFANGKVMAVVGFEVDQVIRVSQNGDEDISVPISAAYNHHYSGSLNNGHKSTLTKLRAGDARIRDLEMAMGHRAGHEPYLPVQHTPTETGAPASLALGGGNGGEYRKTFHGHAPGFAEIIESPNEIQITPMQIDTWNRDKMNLTAYSPFVPGPQPRNSLAVHKDALYSGLLECPLTTRITKDIDSGYDVLGSGSCPDHIQTAAECFAAVKKALGALANRTKETIVDEPATPRGCSVATSNGSSSLDVVFNTATGATAPCGANAVAHAGRKVSLVQVAVSLDVQANVATITMTGPSSVWFGVGFGQSVMKDSWVVIVDGQGKVTERKLGDHVVGSLLAPSVTVVSSKTLGGNRTVVLSRPLKGKTPAHFTFTSETAQLPFINAIGSSGTLGYHKSKTADSMTLLPAGGAGVGGACVCAHKPLPFGSGKGSFVYHPVAGDPGEKGQAISLGFSNKCAPQPRGDLLAQRNPTCDVRYYTGGQSACHHMFSLLDADQPIPWPDKPINYTMKWR